MMAKVTFDTSFYARLDELPGPQQLARPKRVEAFLNTEALHESLGLLNSSDPSSMVRRAKTILGHWAPRLLLSPGEIMSSELAGSPQILASPSELDRIREIFDLLAGGERPPELVAFAPQAQRTNAAHALHWAPIKDDVVHKLSNSRTILKLESWSDFKEAMWNEASLNAVGTRIPPNGATEYRAVVEAVLGHPGAYPYCEGYLKAGLNFVHRMLRDLRSKPREPTVYDLNLVLYMAGLDVLVTAEDRFGGILAEVFGPAKTVWLPHEYACGGSPGD